MKWLLLSIVALVLLVAIVFGGGLGLLLNVKTDANDPDFAAKFTKTMTDQCLVAAKADIGGTLDYQQEALVKQVCECDMKAITKMLAKKGAKTPVEIQTAVNESGPEMDAAFDSCAKAYGLE